MSPTGILKRAWTFVRLNSIVSLCGKHKHTRSLACALQQIAKTAQHEIACSAWAPSVSCGSKYRAKLPYAVERKTKIFRYCVKRLYCLSNFSRLFCRVFFSLLCCLSACKVHVCALNCLCGYRKVHVGAMNNGRKHSFSVGCRQALLLSLYFPIRVRPRIVIVYRSGSLCLIVSKNNSIFVPSIP